MTLRVTNTLTGEKEEFEPRDPDSVLFYYCGLTTSDPLTWATRAAGSTST